METVHDIRVRLVAFHPSPLLPEEGQDVLRTTIARTEEKSYATMYRWRQAKNGFSDPQKQPERTEKDSREKRGRHIKIIGPTPAELQHRAERPIRRTQLRSVLSPQLCWPVHSAQGLVATSHFDSEPQPGETDRPGLPFGTEPEPHAQAPRSENSAPCPGARTVAQSL
ncbi:hypothetical protein CHGG_08168 [Chaetomium globosum CBS 148.51]|uniref:Uncharacterized protein n=1 Tax=Chaetomium globosum (strain ATCC 6205 / CBS 148.51 / DSM 1962 / NBRC 6347 / NRRL 1970) TaxID=306901 RepID=Q2GV36_CHAGB|nr:uncharacterized protein CHGG_08168 [Chaetomium globosum CBS 148.51]EAQ86915.1 hypothetical protein CHGG_08168 [Chaetomium globosum CBS 148.51]